MSEDVIRCAKCGGTLSDGTCTSCGATGQAIKCEHCGALCPGDARWCPSCGRHLPAGAAAGVADELVAPGGGTTRMLLLMGMIVVACVFIWKLQPVPAPTVAIGGLSLLFLLGPGTLQARLKRVVPLLAGGLLASGIASLVAPHSTPTTTCGNRPHMPAPAAVKDEYVPGVVMARFKDGGLDRDHVLADFLNAERPSGTPRTGEALELGVLADILHQDGESSTHEHMFELYGLSESTNPDTHDVVIHFDSRVPVEQVVAEMNHDPAVVFAEPDYIFHATYTPNDPYFDEPYDSKAGPMTQWYLSKIGGPEAWDKLRSVKSNIRLAIIDTGIDYTHPDLKGVMARNSKGEIQGRNFIKTRLDFKDDNGHGTHCAGIANAETDNNTGVSGVGFNSFGLVGCKVLTGKGYGQVDWICNAITWAADNGCRVESMSLGGGRYTQAIQDAINYAWKKGTIVVAAAGNSNTSAPGYPAGCNHVVAVSATTETDDRAFFSNYGTPIAVGAPGVRILATLPTYPCEITRHGYKEGYDTLQGTSMACPVVSGTVAALLAYQPSLTPVEAIERLEATADNTAEAPNGGWEVQFGHGRVNLANAILNRRRNAGVGCLYGQVTDKNGRAVMGASVRCDQVAVTTTDDGMFRLANLSPGKHDVEVTRGSSKITQAGAVKAGCDVNVTAVLK